MNRLNTTSVSLAVTPTVVSTLFSHYLNRKPLKERPTAHLSYDEGLHLIRSFLEFASHHTVEELQAFTAQWVPHPQWVKVETVKIAAEHLTRSAELIREQLGQGGIREVGGREWWQWRKPKSDLEAEWIEMRSDYNLRKKNEQSGDRVMLYIHGGAYFFGSVDEHRYQMQRHARKLKARVLAPKYRLAPQFPFPCGLYDCLAAYLYLLTQQDPSTIIIAGDSAGGGMAVALMCVLRDQGIPLPAGGILLSPWVDLTHSFPSVAGDSPMDYIPQYGFHHKPSRAWPPPNDEDMAILREKAGKGKIAVKKDDGAAPWPTLEQGSLTVPIDGQNHPSNPVISGGIETDENKFLSVTIDSKLVTVKDQIQMYTTNALLSHPLVSPVMQPTLGGLPPLLIMVGGGEILRDEQIYLAHKCANPAKYAPPAEMLTERGAQLLAKYKPTDVQLQVWDDLCHVAPTLSFTRPAKYMYRSVAQFGAWALARAQQKGIEIIDDDNISVISNSGSETEAADDEQHGNEQEQKQSVEPGEVGKAGDPLPPFHNHMIRQRVTRHGITLPLPLEDDLPGCQLPHKEIGVVKQGPVKKWLEAKREWDTRFASAKTKVQGKMVKEIAKGYHELGPGENPPPTALAGRRRGDLDVADKKRHKSLGLALWSLWGSKHDEEAIEREKKADEAPEVKEATPDEGHGARPFSHIQAQQPPPPTTGSRSRSRRRTVTDENQTGSILIDENTPVSQLISQRKDRENSDHGLLSPNYTPETGVAGKRPFLGGLALPFSLDKDADTASMMTLSSTADVALGAQEIRPVERSEAPVQARTGEASKEQHLDLPERIRPAIDSFVTAQEDLPQASRSTQ